MSTFKRILVENHYKKNLTQRTLCFRSNWEISFASFLDSNANVSSWESDYRIKYLDKFNSPPKVRKYLVDFKVGMNDGSTILIEIKPLKTLEPRVSTKSMRFKRIHAVNLSKNYAKFETVEVFCRKIGWKFFLVEKQGHHFKFFNWDIQKKIPIPI